MFNSSSDDIVPTKGNGPATSTPITHYLPDTPLPLGVGKQVMRVGPESIISALFRWIGEAIDRSKGNGHPQATCIMFQDTHTELCVVLGVDTAARQLMSDIQAGIIKVE